MTKQYLILGGPMHRQWVTCADDDGDTIKAGRIQYLVSPETERYEQVKQVSTYVRRRYRHPSWRILLTLYVSPDLERIPDGTVMPGWVEGRSRPCCYIRYRQEMTTR